MEDFHLLIYLERGKEILRILMIEELLWALGVFQWVVAQSMGTVLHPVHVKNPLLISYIKGGFIARNPKVGMVARSESDLVTGLCRGGILTFL